MTELIADTQDTKEIAPLPDRWTVVELADVLSEGIKNGMFAKRERFGKGSPFFNVADVYKSIAARLSHVERVECSASELEAYSLQPSDVIFVRSSLKREGIGHCCFVEEVGEDSVFDCHLMRVRVNQEKLDPQFLVLYALSHAGREALVARSKTTTMTTLNQTGLAGFRVPLPPLEEQRAIVKVLRAVQRSSDSTERLLVAIRLLKHSLMRHVLTFGVTPVQDAEHVELQETHVGDMPSHWELHELDTLAKIGNGSTPKRTRPEYWENGTQPWLTSAKIHEGIINHADQFVTEVAKDQCHLPDVKAGSLLVAITGQGKTLGNTAMVTFDTSVSQHLAYMTFKERVIPEFMLIFLQSQYQKFRQVGSSGGSTRAALTCGFLRGFVAPVPPLIEQQNIADSLMSINKKEKAAAAKLSALNAMFDSLLHELMSGARSVGDISHEPMEVNP